jgi:hypothetical protein
MSNNVDDSTPDNFKNGRVLQDDLTLVQKHGNRSEL